jgi:hypothetical protein
MFRWMKINLSQQECAPIAVIIAMMATTVAQHPVYKPLWPLFNNDPENSTSYQAPILSKESFYDI